MTRKFSIFNFQFSINKKGFTLIELLVVISILGLLAGLVITNVAGVRERARDAQRKSDLKEIQNALEMYKQDQASPSYPNVDADDWGALVTALEGEDGRGYMKIVPNDPLYDPAEGTPTYVYNVTVPLHYSLSACLENASDPKAVPDPKNCESEYKYEVSEP